MRIINVFVTIFLSTTCLIFSQDLVIGVVENDADSKPISNVHVINLNKVEGTITNKLGEFEIKADVNDTLFFSYLGFKSIKIRVTNDSVSYTHLTLPTSDLV